MKNLQKIIQNLVMKVLLTTELTGSTENDLRINGSILFTDTFAFITDVEHM